MSKPIEKLKPVEWLHFILNDRQTIPAIKDWEEIYDFSTKHSIIGVCNPFELDVKLPSELLFQWIGDVEQIKELNKLINRHATELYEYFNDAGFKCCILKGQGNATMYPNALLRCPGDIDVWVDAEKDTIYGYIKELFPDSEESIKHIKMPLFNNVDVDVHYVPLRFYHPLYNRRIIQWLTDNKDEQFRNFVKLEGCSSDISIPTARFNAVYQLGHILVHLCDEGIGLRQIVDYYYVLQNLKDNSDEEKRIIVETWKWLGMLKLAKAIMWIEHEILGLDDAYLLVEPNEHYGRVIANDILEGGNFGKHSQRQIYKKFGKVFVAFVDLRRYMQLMACFPGEAFFRGIEKFKSAFRLLGKIFKI